MYKRIYILRFPKETIDQPIICKLAQQFDVEFNILKADIYLQQDGLIVLEISGHKQNVLAGLKYIREQGVEVGTQLTSIRRDDEKCYQCGACTGICPTGSLHIKRPEMEVLFDPEKCTACGLCVQVCPVRAMEICLNRDVQAIVK